MRNNRVVKVAVFRTWCQVSGGHLIFHIWGETINLNLWDRRFPSCKWKGEPGMGAWGLADYYKDANQSILHGWNPSLWWNAHRSEFQSSVDKMVFSQSFFFAQLWPRTTLLCSRLVWALKYSSERILWNTKANRRFNGEETVISLTTALPTVKNVIRRWWGRWGSPWDEPNKTWYFKKKIKNKSLSHSLLSAQFHTNRLSSSWILMNNSRAPQKY